MAENDTLLAYLSPRLTNHTEDIAVKALEYIFNKSAPSMRAMENIVREGGADIGQIAKVNPWASDQEMTIPDLVGVDGNNVERLLIEAKFWAGLTEHQPNGYLNRLPKCGPAALLFVAPEARIDTLWSSLRHRVEDAGRELVLVISATRHRYSARVVDTEGYLMLVSWSTLLSSLSSAASTAGDSAIEADIRQLRGLAGREDEEAFMPLRADEFGPGFIRRLNQFGMLGIEAINIGRRAGWISHVNSSTSRWVGGYGRSFRLSGTRAWFGLNGDLWSSKGDTPMWLQVEDVSSSAISRLLRDKFRFHLNDSWLVIPIYLKTGVERDQVVEDIVTQLKAIANAIKEATPDT